VREAPLWIAFLAVGGILAAAAIAATNDLGTATELAAVGTALAGVGLVLLVAPVVGHARSPRPDPVGSSLVLLRESFRSGPLGRQAILATVVSLERAGSGEEFGRLSPDEERRLVAADPATFRAWLDERLTTLEQGT